MIAVIPVTTVNSHHPVAQEKHIYKKQKVATSHRALEEWQAVEVWLLYYFLLVAVVRFINHTSSLLISFQWSKVQWKNYMKMEFRL